MFDSDMIPGITRVEAGNGIIVTYKVNSDGEGVWTARIDSDYLAKNFLTAESVKEQVQADSDWILRQIPSIPDFPTNPVDSEWVQRQVILGVEWAGEADQIDSEWIFKQLDNLATGGADSDWVLTQIAGVSSGGTTNNYTTVGADSDWVLTQIAGVSTGGTTNNYIGVDSDWVLTQISSLPAGTGTVDSEWVLANTGTGTGTVDSDWVLNQIPSIPEVNIPADSEWIANFVQEQINAIPADHDPVDSEWVLSQIVLGSLDSDVLVAAVDDIIAQKTADAVVDSDWIVKTIEAIHDDIPADSDWILNQIPSLTGYATETYVDTQIAAIPATDLTGYATESYVDSAVAAVPTGGTGTVDSEWVLDQISGIPTGGTTTTVSGADSDWVISQLPSLSGYATQSYVDSRIPDLSAYATQSWVTTQIAASTPDLSSYATQSWVTSQIPDVSNFATVSYVDNEISQLPDYSDPVYLQNAIDTAVTNALNGVNLDSEYVANVVLKIISREQIESIEQMKEILGITSGTSAPVAPTTTVNTIKYSQSGTVLTSPLKVRLLLNSNNGDVVYDSNITIAAGSDTDAILTSIMYKLNTSQIVKPYINTMTYNSAQKRIEYTFNDNFVKFFFEFNVLQSSDGSVFTIEKSA